MHAVTLLLGVKRSEKTLGAQYLVERHRQKGHVFVIQDTMNHWVRKRGLYVLEDRSAENVCAYAFALTWKLRCGVTLVLDEIHRYFPAPGQGKPPAADSALAELALVGRQPKPKGPHARFGSVCLIGMTQRPRHIAGDLRDLADRIYVGRMWSSSDREWLDEATEDPRWSELARTLPRGKFVCLDL